MRYKEGEAFVVSSQEDNQGCLVLTFEIQDTPQGEALRKDLEKGPKLSCGASPKNSWISSERTKT